MSAIHHPVHPRLRAAVSHIMTVDLQLPGPAYGRSAPFPPTPQHSLNFYPGDATRSRTGHQAFADLPACAIIGPQTTKVDLAMGSHHRFVTVAFHPGGLHRLLRLPMPELLDQPLDAADVLGRELREVTEQLREARQPLAMKNIVEAYLLRKLADRVASPLERSLGLLLRGNPADSVENIAALSCLSLRQFERRSREILGYSPKFFARVARFSRAYRLKVRQPECTWTVISHHCGYYDQMHLIRDFKEFTGTTPSRITREILAAPLTLQDDLRI
ncbi:helix-turn-helix domain-containing protein [Hymenobacter sp. 15J16-1T3B]|uniref:helix-turn-helix domain-containing protein n=1 Tax=Hymenobacter sp. 15J16-1T3B TaxID=2886941 RepID=UPI001D0FEF4D|nr:AraC family transcriptional regulator [Hymenobacter sp. 15J16-1T3B]MCC3160100.1 helix-turn-helix domain-containing protein [Hymenobacter sp. 15J16-1T3B]